MKRSQEEGLLGSNSTNFKKLKNISAVLITGLPGSGKSVVSNVAKEMGFPIFIMGEIVFEKTAEEGYSLSPENVAMMAKKLREELGKPAVAILTVQKVRKMMEKCALSKDVVFIEGLRSVSEYEYFSDVFDNVHLIAVLASQETRYKRIIERQRADKEKSVDDLARRDMRELSFGVSDLVLMADKYIINEQIELIDFEESIKNFLLNLLRG